MAFPDEFLQQIRQANDIAEAFGGSARLKRAGRDYVCLCPFHSEKTPSLHIYTENQSFYCFGCGVGGDIITYVRLTENLDYVAAVRLLAERSGIPMPEDEGGRDELNRRGRIYEMNRQAAIFFRDCLLSDAGLPGREFLRQRGLTESTVRRFGLGYAPDSWNSLKRHMNSLRYSDVELTEASLLRHNAEKNSFYDMFRGRVMFPVIDRTGKIIAFSGRQVVDDPNSGKYVNSTDTPVYRKGENVFSLNFAKNSRYLKDKPKKSLILCEGNIDAVMLHQAGFDNAVAILGTALTAAQARLLRFYCEEAVICYDSDSAGQKATVKAINLLNKEGMAARVLQLKDAKDPDEYIKKFGAEKFESLLYSSDSAISFELNKLKSAVDIEQPGGRAEYLKKATLLLADVDNDYDRLVYVSQVARDCEVTTDGVTAAIDRLRTQRQRGQKKQEKGELFRAAGAIAPGFGGGSRVAAPVSGGAGLFSEPSGGVNHGVFGAEKGIIAYLFHSRDKLPVILRNLNPGDFSDDFTRKLFETLVLRLSKQQSIEIQSLQEEFSAIEVGRIGKIIQENAALPFDDARLNDYIEKIIEHKAAQSRKSALEMSDEELRETVKLLSVKV